MPSPIEYIYSWNLQKINAGGKTNGPPAFANGALFVSVFLNEQQHVFYVDDAGNIWDAFYDAGPGSWNLQKINAGGKTNGPPANAPFAALFVSVFLNEQQHVFYVDYGGGIWDAFYDAGPGSWNLQKINAGGKTNGPLTSLDQAALFVSVFLNEQQHVFYVDGAGGSAGNIWDAFYDAGPGSWNLQKINAGGELAYSVSGGLFVSVFLNVQQHVLYVDSALIGDIWDAFYDAGPRSWNLQKINDGGKTNGPPAYGILGAPFVSVFLNEQQHVFYLDGAGNIWDAYMVAKPKGLPS
jgi:hypothetical protein